MESRGGRVLARPRQAARGRARRGGQGRAGAGPRPLDAPKRTMQTRPPFAARKAGRTDAGRAATWRTECEHERGGRPRGRSGKLRPRGGRAALEGSRDLMVPGGLGRARKCRRRSSYKTRLFIAENGQGRLRVKATAGPCAAGTGLRGWVPRPRLCRKCCAVRGASAGTPDAPLPARGGTSGSDSARQSLSWVGVRNRPPRVPADSSADSWAGPPGEAGPVLGTGPPDWAGPFWGRARAGDGASGLGGAALGAGPQ